MKLPRYLLSCFILFIPILIWNAAFIDYLPKSFRPEIYWMDIPNWMAYTENASRIGLVVISFFMIFSLKSRSQQIGFKIYLIGTFLYFSSWLPLIMSPDSAWSLSLVGFTAPAFTPSIWLIGIGLIGNNSFFNFKYLKCSYLLLSMLFIFIHFLHAHLIYVRIN